MARPHTPTKLLALRGSQHAKRRPQEPHIPAGTPKAPSWLSPLAKKHWKPLSAELLELGLLTKVDQIALSLLVEALAQYLDARDLVYGTPQRRGDGICTPTQHGGQMLHPAVRLMEQSWEHVLRACREFGLSPAARRGVTSAPVATKDATGADKSRFFRQKA